MSGEVLVWSDDGSGLHLALRLQREGVPVRLFIRDPKARWCGAGLVERTETPVPPRGTLTIFDTTGQGALGQFLRARGDPVIGGHPFDRIELDRPFGARVMREHGIQTPPTFAFTAIPAAQKFLATHEGEWFVKVSGPRADTASTHNARSSEAMIRYLTWAKRHAEDYRQFEFQERVEGLEVSCEGWWDGTRFVPPFNCTLEDKKFLAGDHGSRTGCEANAVWALPDEALLPSLTLEPLASTLRKLGVGPAALDLNSIISPQGQVVGIEWTAFRLGFDASQAWFALIGEGLGEQLMDFARGRLARWDLARPEEAALTLRLSRPPYPHGDARLAQEEFGMPLDGELLDAERFTLSDAMLGQDGGLVQGNRDGWLGTVGAIGFEIAQLRAEVLQHAGQLDIAGLQYRIDPVERAERAWAELSQLEYAPFRSVQRPPLAAPLAKANPEDLEPLPPHLDHRGEAIEPDRELVGA